MAENEGLEGGNGSSAAAAAAATATSFSQLLFGEIDDLSLDYGQIFNYSNSSFLAHEEKPPKMLCFGGHRSDGDDGESEIVFGEANAVSRTTTTPQRSGVTCSTDSSSPSSCANSSVAKTLSKSSKKRSNGDLESVQYTSNVTAAAETKQNKTSSKRTKSEIDPSSTGHAKARKEKLGERITALRQLVSPFGKTDTASVLHEAMGYIRFLHDQVQALCSPYLQPTRPVTEGGENGGEEASRKDLWSRGLCLVPVPVACVGITNGADFWLPANQ